jgi:hypothetical protein
MSCFEIPAHELALHFARKAMTCALCDREHDTVRWRRFPHEAIPLCADCWTDVQEWNEHRRGDSNGR